MQSHDISSLLLLQQDSQSAVHACCTSSITCTKMVTRLYQVPTAQHYCCRVTAMSPAALGRSRHQVRSHACSICIVPNWKLTPANIRVMTKATKAPVLLRLHRMCRACHAICTEYLVAEHRPHTVATTNIPTAAEVLVNICKSS